MSTGRKLQEKVNYYHNPNRPKVRGFNGKTPSEACGIKIKGENKWITLIQNASKE
ncbi:MAG: hypothetical protein ACRDFB_10415 [Rhabdochlamydiaceae bacterium]